MTRGFFIRSGIMLTSSQRSCLCILCFALVIGTGFNALQAVEVHVVGEAAYKYADGEWSCTVTERLGYAKSIWAFADDDIFIGDGNGNLFHFDGYEWNCMLVDSGGGDIEDIWGTSNGNLYICVYTSSGQGRFIHFDGSAFSEIILPYQSDRYHSIYGFSEDDIYLVAEDSDEYNVIYHNNSGDPQSWELVNLPPEISSLEFNCNCVWGSSGDDVFIGGMFRQGILHYDGQHWNRMDLETLDRIGDIWGISSNDVYAVTWEDLYHYDGNAWTVVLSTTDFYMHWVRGTSSDDIIVGGYTRMILHYDGIEWTELWNTDLTNSADAFMFTSIDAIILDRDGQLFRYDGSTIDRFDQDYWIFPLISVSGTAINSVYAGAEEGYVYRYDGSSWSEMARPTTENLNDIIAFSDDDICVLSPNAVYHYNGFSWNLIGSGDVGGVTMWGLSSDNLYTAGGGRVSHYDGSNWEELRYIPSVCYDPPYCEEGSATYYIDIWGTSDENVYVGGRSDWWGLGGLHLVSYGCRVLLNYNGIEWVGQDLPYYCPIGDPPSGYQWISAIWGSSATDIWAGGSLYDYSFNNYVIRFDGSTWNMIYTPFSRCSDIWGSSSTDIYFLDGKSGDVYHYDGVDFILADLTHTELRDIWGTDLTSTHAETPQSRFSLLQNHPNPFNPSTTISFSLRERGAVSLAVYDVAGRLVRVLIDGVKEAGSHDVAWNGKDSAGRGVASGVYFYRLEAGEFIETRKMVLLR